MSQSSALGVLGLGIIGSRVADNLRQAGREVYVWSRSPRAVPNFMPSPRAVAESANVVQIFVRDDAALMSAMADMQPVLGPRHVLLCHSTVTPGAVRTAADQAALRGAGFLDAPFTGSKLAAQAAKLVYYVGGDADLLAEVQSVLALSSQKVIAVGKVGDASLLKIATNMITAITVKGVQEALALTQAQGIDPALLQLALESNANYSPLIGMKLPAMIQQDFAPHFSLSNMLKDADYALRLAQDAKLALPALQVMAEAMRLKLASGCGDNDFSAIGKQP